jgi:hypothetical protein
VVNWNSGVAIQSAIAGTPIITGPTSLAHEISEKYENIERLQLPDRRQWFEKILHTEWLVEDSNRYKLRRFGNEINLGEKKVSSE